MKDVIQSFSPIADAVNAMTPEERMRVSAELSEVVVSIKDKRSITRKLALVLALALIEGEEVVP